MAEEEGKPIEQIVDELAGLVDDLAIRLGRAYNRIEELERETDSTRQALEDFAESLAACDEQILEANDWLYEEAGRLRQGYVDQQHGAKVLAKTLDDQMHDTYQQRRNQAVGGLRKTLARIGKFD